MFRLLVSLALGLALAGCAPGEHLFVANKIVNAGQDELPRDMLGKHLIATVAFDEDYAGRGNRRVRGHLYLHGVKEGTPEYGYRMVGLNTQYLKGLAYYADGQFTHPTVAAVPDHLPKLKAWDIVEFRHVDSYRTLTDFSSTGEGNMVVRVLCHAGDPEYKKCAEAAPKVGKWTGGEGPTPYPASAKSYGFTFTPAYDAKGQPLRPLAEFKPR